MSATGPTQQFKVRVSSVDDILWEGLAESVSSTNQAGRFDILPGHANFVTMIETEPIIVSTPSGEKTFTHRNAVIYVTNGEVKIFTGV